MSGAAQVPAAGDTALRLFAIVGYVLLLLAFTNGITAIVGAVIAMIKRSEARGTPYESHFRNMIGVFWVGVALIVAVLALASAGVAGLFANWVHPLPILIAVVPAIWLVTVAFVVWYLYRVIKGLARALDGRAYS